MTKYFFVLSLIISLTLATIATASLAQADLGQAQAATNWLLSQQTTQGSIGSLANTGWALQAIRATGQTNQAGLNYLSTNLGSITGGSATDIERTILSVIAAGGNPRSTNGTDLVALLKTKVISGQIGLPGLLNDDIFGILALLAAGEPTVGPVSQSASYLASKQASNGSFSWSAAGVGDSNDTATAIMALELAKQNGAGVSYNQSAALGYIQSLQSNDGGFKYSTDFNSDGASTAWVVSALYASGIDPNTWTINGKSGLDYLTSLITSSGGLSATPGGPIDILTTSFGAIALAGKHFPISRVSLPISPTPIVSPSPVISPSPEISPTPSLVPSPSPIPSPIPSPSVSSPTPIPSLTTRPTPELSPSPLISPIPSPMPSPSPIPSPNIPSPTPLATPAPTPTPTPTPRITPLFSPTPQINPSSVSSSTISPTPTSLVPTPTASPVTTPNLRSQPNNPIPTLFTSVVTNFNAGLMMIIDPRAEILPNHPALKLAIAKPATPAPSFTDRSTISQVTSQTLSPAPSPSIVSPTPIPSPTPTPTSAGTETTKPINGIMAGISLITVGVLIILSGWFITKQQHAKE